MEWLNYHHLLYFYVTAREGSISKAAVVLRLAQPTVSGQLKALEEALGEQLFSREGRKLELTDVGRHVYSYAEEIFALGRELQSSMRTGALTQPQILRVGISDVVPKLVAYRLLEVALKTGSKLTCEEDKAEALAARLVAHELDVVLADGPMTSGAKPKTFNHLLGECGVSFFASDAVLGRLKGPFPERLHGAPMLLPTSNTVLRHSLDRWFERTGIRPWVVAEFHDSALMKTFGEQGAGVFPGPTAIASEISRGYNVRPVGTAPGLKERFYAITVERRIRHPGVVAIADAAKHQLFV